MGSIGRCNSTTSGILLALAIVAPATVHAQVSLTERLVVHGYLTQAFAKSSQLPIVGITTRGTSNYRVAALQFRYTMTDADHFVLQLKHRRIGTSLIMEGESDVGLDWAFYAHRFSALSVRVGRVPIPMGIYNETRAVGTILPFYRAPMGLYPDAAENIDGVVLSNRLPLGRWALESTVHGGGVDYKAVLWTPAGPRIVRARAEKDFGAYLWLETPLTGLRIGAGSMKVNATIGTQPMSVSLVRGAIDGTFEHFFVRAEALDIDNGGVHQTRAYLHTQVNVTRRLAFAGQLERDNARNPLRGKGQYTEMYDQVLGATFALQPNVLVKLEGHRVRGYTFDTFMDVRQPPGKSTYIMASLAVSF